MRAALSSVELLHVAEEHGQRHQEEDRASTEGNRSRRNGSMSNPISPPATERAPSDRGLDEPVAQLRHDCRDGEPRDEPGPRAVGGVGDHEETKNTSTPKKPPGSHEMPP